jgi:hypothetical protein
MSNLSENRINVVIATEDIVIMNKSIATFVEKIPANAVLSDSQRASYNSIDVDNKVYAEDCLEEAKRNGEEILPPYINLAFMQNDLTVFEQLDQLESNLRNTLRRVTDAKRIAGHEAFGLTSPIYKAFKSAHESGIPNATTSYLKLKARYDANGKVGRKPDAPIE